MQDASRDTDHRHRMGHILSDNSMSANHGMITNEDAAKDARMSANGHMIANDSGPPISALATAAADGDIRTYHRVVPNAYFGVNDRGNPAVGQLRALSDLAGIRHDATGQREVDLLQDARQYRKTFVAVRESVEDQCVHVRSIDYHLSTVN